MAKLRRISDGNIIREPKRLTKNTRAPADCFASSR